MKRLLTLLIAGLISSGNIYAQCAMCKATLETSDGSVGGGINEGILYIMPVPYIILGIIGFLIYRKVKKSRKEHVE